MRLTARASRIRQAVLTELGMDPVRGTTRARQVLAALAASALAITAGRSVDLLPARHLREVAELLAAFLALGVLHVAVTVWQAAREPVCLCRCTCGAYDEDQDDDPHPDVCPPGCPCRWNDEGDEEAHQAHREGELPADVDLMRAEERERAETCALRIAEISADPAHPMRRNLWWFQLAYRNAREAEHI